MNIESVKQYIIKTIENYSFYRRLAQAEEPVKTLLEKQFSEWQDIGNYLFEHYSKNDYSLGWVSKSGNETTRIELFQRNCLGTLYQLEYRKVSFNAECTLNGEINRIYLVYNGFRSHSGWIELFGNETIDSLYNSAIEIVRKDKREIMNHFNKLIKDTKIDYRERLSKVNAVLKQASK